MPVVYSLYMICQGTQCYDLRKICYVVGMYKELAKSYCEPHQFYSLCSIGLKTDLYLHQYCRI